MILFAIALLCLGGLVALVSGIWTVAFAFQREVDRSFAIDWREARLPLIVGLASVFLTGSALLKLAHGRLTAPFQSALAAVQTSKAEEKAISEESMSAVRLDADRQLQLINLKKREAALLAKKAALSADDQAGAERLSDEIRKYNSELRPVLAQTK